MDGQDCLELKWHGPLSMKLRNFPPYEKFLIPVVYLYFRFYEGGDMHVYAGKSKQFSKRLAEHYAHFISSKDGTLYQIDGSIFREGGIPLFFDSISNNIDEVIEYAKADCLRTNFIYAKLDKDEITNAEATIIRILKSAYNNENKFIFLNGAQHKESKNYKIKNDLSDLNVSLLEFSEINRIKEILSYLEGA